MRYESSLNMYTPTSTLSKPDFADEDILLGDITTFLTPGNQQKARQFKNLRVTYSTRPDV
jgi:hypothetical protein